jgi:hypothetical protein
MSADRVTPYDTPEVPTGADTSQAVQMARLEGFVAGQMETAIARAISEANAPLLEEIRLLRGEIEAMKETAQNAQESPQKGQTGKEPSKAGSAALGGKAREARPFWRAFLGLR